MSQQDLDNADVHAKLEHVRGKAMAERVRSKTTVEAALASRFFKRGVCGGVRKMRDDSPAGE